MKKLIALLLLIAAPSLAQYPPYDVNQVTIDSQASVINSESFCSTLVAATNVNFWTVAVAANSTIGAVPNLSVIRYITIQNMTSSTTPFATGILAYKLGRPAGMTAMADGVQVMSGVSAQINIRRPNNGATVAGTFPAGPVPITLRAAGAVSYCATVWW